MYETILKLWKDGKLGEANLNKAITLGWITNEQKEFIMDQPRG